MKNKFTFGGISSADLGLIIDGSSIYPIPQRDLESVEIPGRNGDLLFDNNRWKNVKIEYKCLIGHFKKNYSLIRNFLASQTGYKKLEDTYNLDVYRIARLSDSLDPETGPHKRTAQITLSFDCKPQCFYKAGDIPVSVKNGDCIINKYAYNALPLIRIYGYGTLQIGSYAITISKHNKGFIDVDCDLMDAFSGSDNMNSFVAADEDEFPILVPGENEIKAGETITQIEITPRWWTL